MTEQRITARKNPLIQQVRRLLSSRKEREQAGLFVSDGVKLLSDTGIVEYLSFGSETGSIDALKPISEILANEPENYKKALKKYLEEGLSFPSARMKAVSDCGFEGEIIKSPNNILGVEYIKAIKRLKSDIKPFTIKRQGNGYNSESLEGSFVSASGIRKNISEGGEFESFVPEKAAEIYKREISLGHGPLFLKDFEDIINFQERRLGKNGLKAIEDVTEGLENKIIESPWDIEEKIEFLKSKRYTRTKIQRMLLHVLLEIEKDFAKAVRENGYIPYIKVLGFRKDAEKLLDEIKRKSKLPLIVNLREGKKVLEKESLILFENEIKYDDFYKMPYCDKKMTMSGKDYSRKVLKI